ncbi:hypothetical protein A3F07_02805 [candidate division WWE3 bacterium RIFCSPHIGHO2_12_FULL_38_15]|uniref:Lipid A biosynthesis N-terminal domain-containing protein n=1 Tax=candidate division WWE3 bacterium RIFCSPHIGHO2_02_FULL_38_14 TaxID=1802620 RepID=A0A1F4V9T9_UNCKA|nr:MAG: hypothetical protein A2793_04430 [candidate division WWE3 bacterium RIFCSPHIGHO2_01_FULL_38_45]OGC49342.1 MAG: hypothetical protein A3F07_02805 [candidate division WWE3 bacterium RIFCSPHIGHO2_12_FULL_38_15]OGC53945.1 MAG: hypothetical protein A3B64_02910 [candidate division WWE3 bacterium RIFCSPLOWO2_01_FULL_37_24]OGC54021.1 MAG: hypothetical protein A3D91_04645 [candidate division WWE3 bacterium RIFCSPHIGHO2_02_FULL_38_14]
MPGQIQQIIEKFWDPWIIFGFTAQFVFFMRFVVQWWESEKKKQSVIPVAFWYLSIAGSLMILVYSIRRQDIVFTTASILNTLIYIRNLMLIHNKKKADRLVS